jgi:hypothetical protein
MPCLLLLLLLLLLRLLGGLFASVQTVVASDANRRMLPEGIWLCRAAPRTAAVQIAAVQIAAVKGCCLNAASSTSWTPAAAVAAAAAAAAGGSSGYSSNCCREGLLLGCRFQPRPGHLQQPQQQQQQWFGSEITLAVKGCCLNADSSMSCTPAAAAAPAERAAAA